MVSPFIPHSDLGEMLSTHAPCDQNWYKNKRDLIAAISSFLSETVAITLRDNPFVVGVGV